MSSDAGAYEYSIVGVQPDRQQQLNEFFSEERIELKAGAENEGLIRIAGDDERRECSLKVLYAGGWIRCPVARKVANNLGVDGKSIGKLMDFLEIKIRDCELGCFK